ncbi:MAG TPA: RNA polymerase sigma factor [Chloroflexota bacterium]|nr:RNA polymerase sigma factor [Chloroflexota bacterium]
MTPNGAQSRTAGAPPIAEGFAETFAAERARLVRLCARATGDPEAAEDLAQETLFEAWRAAHKLPSSASPDERGRWLSGIARNVCLRWARRRGRELSRRVFRAGPHASHAEGPETHHPLSQVADDFDLHVELERGELVRLLDRAMGLLPPETRRVLYEQVVAESPLAETALRLGLSHGAVAMRLQRGKLALRRVLVTELHQDALALGLFGPEDVGWQQTRLWCTFCGRHRLLGRFLRDRETLELRCGGCPSHQHSTQACLGGGFRWDGVTGFRAVTARIRDWHLHGHVPFLETRVAPCSNCRRPTPMRIRPIAPTSLRPFDRHLIVADCDACGATVREMHDWLVLCLKEGRTFLRDHPRVRLAGTRRVNAQAQEAVVTTYESVTAAARYEVVSAAETLRILGVYVSGAEGSGPRAAPETVMAAPGQAER